MLYLLWGLLNIGVSLFFIGICFRATRLVRENMGLFAAIIFIGGLLSFVTRSDNKDQSKRSGTNEEGTWSFKPLDSLTQSSIRFTSCTLDKSLLTEYELSINYSKDLQKQVNFPVSATSMQTGWVSGLNWKPTYIWVDRTEDNSVFAYVVDGTIEWKLLGVTVFSQGKEFKGKAIIK